MKMSGKLVNFNAYIQYKKMQSTLPKGGEKLRSMQFKKLKKLLSHAYSNFDFYRELMDGANFDPKKFQRLEEISMLPVITKNDYRDFTAYQLKKYPQKYKDYFQDHTSGSTGIPLTVYRTQSERAYLLSKFLRAFFNNGYTVFDTTYSVLAPSRYSGRDSIIQKLGIVPRVQSPFTNSAEELTRRLIESKADVLYGNVSSLVQMAVYINQNNIAVKPLKFYLATGEELDEKSATVIKKAFGKNCINHYGSVELSTMGYRKMGEDHFHFYHDTNLLEVVDDNGQPSDEGINVITDFHVYSFPMIRYKLGDCVETEIKDGLPAIKRIRGRKEDSIIMKDGSKKSSYFVFEIFGMDDRIKQYKLIQEDLDSFRAEVVIGDQSEKENLSKDIIRRFGQFLDMGTALKIDYVDEIGPESNGKLARFFSKVSAAQKAN